MTCHALAQLPGPLYSGSMFFDNLPYRISGKSLLIQLTTVLVASACAAAAEIDTTTLTAVGSNTNIVVTGTFGPNANTTAYSAPNTPYTLSFSVLTVPTSFVALNDDPQVFVLDTVAMVNGVNFAGSTVGFFTPDIGGGISVCLSIVCSPAHEVSSLNFEIYSEQLYSGSYLKPTLLDGVAHVDSTKSYIEYATPEPSTVALASLGLLFAAGTKRFRVRVSKRYSSL